MEGADKNNMVEIDLNKIDSDKIKVASGANKIKINYTNNLQQQKEVFCNSNLKKHVSIILIFVFLLAFIGSAIFFLGITYTNKFNESIVDNLVLRNGSKSFEWWKDTPVKPLIKVHIFNYTNIDEVLKGKEKKIKVQDIGPYVYEEVVSKTNLTFTDGNKITFYENRSQIFSKNFSGEGLSESDLLRVPNVPLLLGIQRVKNEPLTELQLKSVMTMTSPQEFHTKTVNEYLFGYTDAFVNAISLGIPNFTKEKVGIIGTRKGVSTDNLTIFTGEDTLDNLGRVYAMNNQTNMTYWSTSECNQIRGSDGTQFPPSSLDTDQNLEIFLKAICRTLTLKYDREATVLNGLPALRYRPLPNIFGNSKVNPNNKCYCDADEKKCPPSGVFDAEKCMGVAILMSYPHFYEGDEILLSPYEGLTPNKNDHETYADIHPRMAFPIGGFSRLQINLRVKKLTTGIFVTKTWYDKLPDDLILPLLWFEITVDNIPPDFLAMIFNTTHSANATFLAFQYTSIICMFLSLLLLVSTTLIYVKKLSGPMEEVKGMPVVMTFQAQPEKTETLYPTLPVQS